ncbi:hypothetical protein P153DRAFT_401739 [Dothidotthia symphoricarpi CBS 119687]|uniref:Uncharacterized protein n=1 Tax=Dothidotthia symphoricarpi CBS 119687 TaxID=1392245 RepID=A0A6A5ZVY7_9PLEO|nr:uncharacterized protein P153DRAFT_401739 [Dothidotthia symphoricarpi CBS 119687]KAF2123689.1 hypothetical protein P153DRAFT_401739 [Dothidotthia symphoricarpi CBS 119687]
MPHQQSRHSRRNLCESNRESAASPAHALYYHALDPPHLMPLMQSPPSLESSPRKRPHPLSPSPDSVDKPHSHPKRRRFWDSLSYIHLTRAAIAELNRRSIEESTAPVVDELPRSLPDIQHYARHGGPDLTDLRNYSLPTDSATSQSDSTYPDTMAKKKGATMADSSGVSKGKHKTKGQGGQGGKSTKTGTTPSSSKTKNSSVYDQNFEQCLIDHHIFPPGYLRPQDEQFLPAPVNISDIQEVLQARRPSLDSLAYDSDWRSFVKQHHASKLEIDVMKREFPLIQGGDDGSMGTFPWNNLNPLFDPDEDDEDKKLTAGNPDIYYGTRPELVDRRIRKTLDKFIIPSVSPGRPIVPNFAVAIKAPGGNVNVAKKQVTYDGALCARAMLHLASYGHPELDYHGLAHVITSRYQDGTLHLYACHVGPPQNKGAPGPDGLPEYITTSLCSFAMTNSVKTFCEGAAAYRNARDWCKEQRDILVRAATAAIPPPAGPQVHTPSTSPQSAGPVRRSSRVTKPAGKKPGNAQ